MTRVLQMSYACEPFLGSEPTIGWNWAQLAAAELDTHVITRESNRQRIEAHVQKNANPRLHFHYVELPRWQRFWKKGKRGLRTYYSLWLAAATRRARELNATKRFDVLHHVNFPSYIAPTGLGEIGPPLVLGPIAGVEPLPGVLMRTLDRRAAARDLVRHGLYYGARMGNPRVARMMKKAAFVLCRTPRVVAEVERWVPPERRTIVGEIGVEAAGLVATARTARRPGPVRIFCAARFDPHKGHRLGLSILNEVASRGVPFTMDFFGVGAELGGVRRRAEELGLSDRIRWRGRVPREQLLAEIPDFDVFLYPSFRDGTPTVLCEVLGRATPVVALRVSGMEVLADGDRELFVDVRSPLGAIVRDAADRIECWANDEPAYLRASARALEIARRVTWQSKLPVLLDAYETAIRLGPR